LYYYNPDSKFYLTQLFASKQLQGIESILALLIRQENSPEGIAYIEGLLEKHPKSSILKHIRIRYAPNAETLLPLLEVYFQEGLKKGIPSLFNSLKDMYSIEWKVVAIEKLLITYQSHLVETQSFPSSTMTEDPTVLLWIYYYLAQHYAAIHDLLKALEYINLAVEHTPTLVELYMQKARILKVI
jgi:peptide alpha-N-acetyltransferase